MKPEHAWLRRLPVLLGIGFALLIALGIWFLKDKFQKPPQTKKVVQQITMLQPPPPPPPPPEQKPPEPEEVKEEKVEEPEPEPEPEPEQAEEAPPAEDLGIDAEGTAGGDGFGLAARKGGASLLGGGGGGNAIIWYGGQIKRQVEDQLQGLLAGSDAAQSGFTVVIAVWVADDGKISRSELVSGSGKTHVDQAIRDALPRLRANIGKAPPGSMPQPVRIRVMSRV